MSMARVRQWIWASDCQSWLHVKRTWGDLKHANAQIKRIKISWNGAY